MKAPNYWVTSMEAVMEEAGVAVTPDQLQAIAQGAYDASRMESEGTGAIHIPDPRDERISALQQRVKAEGERADQLYADFIKNICTRRNVEPHQVRLEGNGDAVYFP